MCQNEYLWNKGLSSHFTEGVSLIFFPDKGHPEGKSITSITGNITDQKLLANTFAGVHSVYHVAGHISYGTFPDFDTMYKVNVEGTIY